MHALLQGFAPLLQPLLALRFLFHARALPLRLRSAGSAEIAIRLEIVFQIAADQFDHDGVIEKIRARVGRRRGTKASQRVENTLTILRTERPTAIRDHFQHGTQPQETLLDEAGQLRAFGAFQHFASGGDDVIGVALANAGLRLLRHCFEVAQILIAQMEADA